MNKHTTKLKLLCSTGFLQDAGKLSH